MLEAASSLQISIRTFGSSKLKPWKAKYITGGSFKTIYYLGRENYERTGVTSNIQCMFPTWGLLLV